MFQPLSRCSNTQEEQHIHEILNENIPLQDHNPNRISISEVKQVIKNLKQQNRLYTIKFEMLEN